MQPTKCTLQPVVYSRRNQAYVTTHQKMNADRMKTQNQTRSYFKPGIQARRPNTAMPSIRNNQGTYHHPMHLPEEWKGAHGSAHAPSQRAQSAQGSRKTDPRQSYKHFKFIQLSAGREVHCDEDTADIWEDQEPLQYPAGLGYGTKHRNHYKYRSRNMQPKVPLVTSLGDRYSSILADLKNKDANYN